VLDRAGLYVSSWQFTLVQPGVTPHVYGCGPTTATPEVGHLESTLFLSDGGSRVGPASEGQLGVPFDPGAQIGLRTTFRVESDGGFDQFDPSMTVVTQDPPNSITFRYDVTEVLLPDNAGTVPTPYLVVEETHHFSSSTETVVFDYDSICPMSQPTGFY
jgi:hypothetical protein